MYPVLGTMMPEVCEDPHLSCQTLRRSQIVGMRSLHSRLRTKGFAAQKTEAVLNRLLSVAQPHPVRKQGKTPKLQWIRELQTFSHLCTNAVKYCS